MASESILLEDHILLYQLLSRSSALYIFQYEENLLRSSFYNNYNLKMYQTLHTMTLI